MRDEARRGSTAGILAYLVLAFGIAWGFWDLLLPKSATANIQLFQLYALPGAFAPAIAAFVVRKWITREGFGDAGLALHLRRWRYYLVAWLLPFVVLAFIVIAAPLLGLGHADFSFAKGFARIAPHARVPPALAAHAGYIIPLQMLFAAPLAAPLLFGEEFGWRGYLQLRLLTRRPTLAALATGLIWGLWHLPLIARGYEFSGNLTIATAVFCTSTVMLSIIFGWLRQRSGSIWTCCLAHSAANDIGGSLALLWFADRSKQLFVGYLGILSWIPLGVLCVWIVARRANVPRGEHSPTTP